MSIVPEVVDIAATGNSELIPPIDIGYSGHTYSRCAPTSAPINWVAGSQLSFQPTTKGNALYDLSESYINVEFAPYVVSSADGVKRYLSSLSTVAVDCTFGTSIFSSCDVTIGDGPIQSIRATQPSFPYVAGVMAVLENPHVDTEGAVREGTLPIVSGPPLQAIPALGTGFITSDSEIYKDCKAPYDVCLDASALDAYYQARAGWPRRVLTTTTIDGNDYDLPSALTGMSPAALYRAELIRRKNSSYRIADNGLPCVTQATIKLPSSLRSLKAKIPGTSGLNITMTRAPDFYALHGDALYEYVLSTGVVPADAAATITIGMDISRFDLYLKVLYPTEALVDTMRIESREQLFHFNKYMSTVRVMTSDALAETFSFTRRPKAVLVGVVNKDFILPTPTALNGTGGAQGKAQYNVTPTLRSGGRWSCQFTDLTVTVDGKRYPDDNGYTTLRNGAVAYAANDRAYREFTKCLRNPESVKFFQWLNCIRLFAFDLTESGQNIHDFTVPRTGPCQIEVNGTVVLPGALDPSSTIGYGFDQYCLVVIGVIDGFFSLRDFQAVEVD